MIKNGSSQTTFIGFTETGDLINFKIVTIVSDFKNDKSFVVYTEADAEDESDKSLYAAEFIPNEEDFEGGTRLYKIEDQDSWNLVTTVVNGLSEQQANVSEDCSHDCHSCSGCS